MKTLHAKKLFLTAFLILILTNLIVLFGVLDNRKGEPKSQITLTERELQVPYSISKENSGLSLRILWQSLGEKNLVNYRGYQSPVWLTVEKLKTLGYHIDKIKKKGENRYGYNTSKECFIVLEYDGEAYQEALKRAEVHLEEKKQALSDASQDKILQSYHKIAKNTLKNRKEFESRLYAIDAGKDALILGEQYPDRSKYIITKGIIHIYYNFQQKKIYGNISNLSIANIHVPLEFRKTLEPIIQKKQSDIKKSRTYPMVMKHAPRFKATIAYGKRFEPWIVAINPILKDKE